MARIFYAVVLCFCGLNAFAWNAMGHKLIAQIAYDHLSPNAKTMCHQYLNPLDFSLSNETFLASSIWLDQIKYKKIYWYDAMHYIDIPFSVDGTMVPSVERSNAVWAINNAQVVLLSKKTNVEDKRLALRMLIHIIGDIHQPLHAITRVNSQLPGGDLGGNLFPLGKNSVANNLHKYWDNGAGLFLDPHNANSIKILARDLEKKQPCNQIDNEIRPPKWAKMSYKLAIKHVYQLNPKEVPNKFYQKNAQDLVQKQVVYAGCRLAHLLNQMSHI